MGTPLRTTVGHRRFGIKIRNIRKHLKLSQEELAFKIGVETSYVGLIERGKRNPTLDKIFKLATALKVLPEELFK